MGIGNRQSAWKVRGHDADLDRTLSDIYLTRAMDDDVFGTSIWSAPSHPTASTTTQESTSTSLLTPQQPSYDLTDSQDRFDDFDNFEVPTEVEGGGTDDDDFGDFGDFGDAEIVEEGTTTDGFAFEQTPEPVPVVPLQLDPMPDRDELRRRIDELLGPIVGPIDWNIVTDEPIREREGPDQILVTPERWVPIASTSSVWAKQTPVRRCSRRMCLSQHHKYNR
jgi:hypothetical protein